MAPAVVLMLDSDVESKRRGLEAGADDFVARPIYVQEVVARSRALLQRRDRERLELSAHDNERFVSTIEDVPLVDLLRAIAANQKSGVALVMGGEGARGELYFRQGRVVDAEVGRLSGRDAVFRLFCWSSGRLAVEWKSIRRKDTDRDGAARSPDGGAAPGGRLAAAARGRAAARHHLRGRLPACSPSGSPTFPTR